MPFSEMNVAHIDDEIIPFVSFLLGLYARIVLKRASHIGRLALLLRHPMPEGRQSKGPIREHS
jgi:hypothetical protein